MLISFDQNFSVKLYHLVESSSLLIVLTKFFAIWALPILILVLLYEIYKKHWAVYLSSCLGIFIIWSINQVISYFVYRPRPFLALDNYIIPLVDHSIDSSFPSDHTVVAFAIAAILSAFIKKPRATWILFAAALLIGFSRIGGGVHYFTDVLAAAILGTSLAFGWVTLTRDIDKKLEKKYKL